MSPFAPARLVAPLVLAAGLVTGTPAGAQVSVTAQNGLPCAGSRGATGCTAGEFTTIVTLQTAAGTPPGCVDGDYVLINAGVQLSGTNADRYDVAFTTGENQNDPRLTTGMCSVATFPVAPDPPWFQGGANTCGDYRATATSTPVVNNIKVLCKGDAGGNLMVPYTLMYSNISSRICTGPLDVTTNSGSKCNAGLAIVPVATFSVQGSVTITKQTSPSGSVQSFGFTASGPSPIPPEDTSFNLVHGATRAVRMGISGTAAPLTITESAVAGWDPTASIACTRPDGSSAAGFVTINNATRTIVASLSNANPRAVCTITNTKLPTVTLTKVSNGGTGSFSFTGTNGFGSDSIATVTSGVGVAGATRTLAVAGAATTITESIPAGYALTAASCTGLGAGGTATPDLVAGTVALDAAATAPGSNVACTFTNTSVSAPTVTKGFAAPDIAAGGSTNLTVTIGNPNAVPITLKAALVDNFPAGVAIGTAGNTGTCAGATATAGAGSFTVAGGTVIPAGGCTVTVNVTSSTAGAAANTIAAGALQTTAGANAAPASATLNVYAPPTVAKSFGAATIAAGGTTTLTLSVASPAGNPGAIGTVVLPDTFPGGLALADTSFGFTPAACGTVTKVGGGASAAGDGGAQLNVASLAAGGSCQVVLNVTSGTPGAITNTTGAATAATPVALTGGVANASLTVLAAPTVTKGFAAGDVAVGATTTLTITVQNANAVALTGVAFADNYPAPIANSGTPGASIGGVGCTGTLTATAWGTSLALTGGTVPASTTCTYTVQVQGAAAGSGTNSTGLVTSANGASATAASATLNVYAPPTVAKSFTPATIGPGGSSTLAITVTNPAANPGSLTGASVNDTFTGTLANTAPGSVTCTLGGSATLTGGANGGTSVGFTGGTIPPGASCTIVQGVTATSTNTNATTAPSATGPLALTGTAATGVVLTVSVATLTKAFGAPSIADGAATTLVFTLANGAGNPAQSGIGFTDTLPSGLAFGSGAPGLTYAGGCSGPAAAAYVSGTGALTISGVAMAGGTASCTVTVAGLTNAPAQVNAGCPAAGFTNGAASIGSLANLLNGATDQCLVVNRVNPSLTKSFVPGTIDQGGASTLTFAIANGGTYPAQSAIAFTDTLPANLLIATPNGLVTDCPGGSGVVTATAGTGSIAVAGATLNAGQASCTVSVNVTSNTPGVYANTNAGNITGAANVTTTGVNANLTVLPLPALAKAFSPTVVGAAQNAVLTFTVTNLAGSPARTGLTFTDTLPPGAVIGTPAGVVNNCGGSPAVSATPGAGSFAIGAPGVNAAVGPSTCTIRVNVTSATAGTYVNGNGQVAAGTGLLNAVTDQTLTVLDRPTVAKSFGAASIASGGTTALTVTLTNPNAVPATGVAFTDVFPAAPGAMTLANVTTSNTCGGTLTDNGGGALGAGDAGIQLTGGTIPAGASCAVTVNVTAVASGTYTNTLAAGAVASANAGSNAAPASASLIVTAPPTIAKAFGPATIAVDGTSTITFTLTNANGVALTGAAFTDTLANMAIGANGAAGGGCAGAAGNSFTAGQTALSFSGLTIPASGSCTVTVVVTSDIPGAHGNQASGVSSAQAATGAASNVATLTVTAAAPTIAKAFSPATIAADATSTVTFTLASTNGIALTSAGFTDALANMAIAANGNAGGTCAGAAGNAVTAGQTALTVSNLAIPANGSCTVTVVVTSDVPGAHPNTASGVTSAQAPAGAASNTATLTVTGVAPTIAKAFAPATIAAGATSTITFTIANTLGVPLTTGAFADTLANMSINATGAAGGTCAGAAGNSFTAGQTALSFTGLTVPANGNCTVTVVVASSVPGTHNNATTAFTSAEAPASAVSNTAVLTVTAVAPTIAKAFAPASIPADGTSTITFTITNPQAVALTSANFTDTLANISVAAAGAAGGTCAGAGGNYFAAGQTSLAFTGLTIPALSSCTVTVAVSSDLPGTHPNQASGVASTQAPTGAPSNTASLTVTAAPATIAKAFSPAGIPVFSTSTITFTLANGNGIPLTSAGFKDTLANMQVNATGPAGGTCAGAATNNFTAGATGLLDFSGLTIPANGSCTVTVVVASNVVGTHPNVTTGVTSAEAATGAASNVANLTVQPLPPTISKQFTPSGILSGGVTTLVVTVGNPNPSAITVTSVTDTYPAGITTAGTPATSTTCLPGGAVTFNAGSVTLTGGLVPAMGSCTFQVAVTAATQGLYTNTIPAGALTTSGGFNTLAASASLTVDPVADVAVIKSAPATIGTGQVLGYTVSVVNNGPDAANGTQVADTVPAQLNGVVAVCGAASGGAVCGTVNVAGNAVSGTITTLPAGGSVTFTISGTATGLGAITNTATVSTPGGVFDPVPGNNSSSAGTTILAPDLTLTKTHAGNFTVGVNGTYSLTVNNGGGSLATSGAVTVVDTLPAGLAFVSGGGTGWTCAAAGQAVTCTTSASIAAGTSAPVLSITVAVSSTAVPSVLNVATVSGGGEPAAAAGNNTASDNTIVVSASANAFAPDGAQTGMPGSVVFYPHTFNAGLAGSVAFSTNAIATPAVPGWSQAIYRDTNCNAVLDGAEGAAPLAGAVAVNPGDAVCIIVRDSIPGAAPYNALNVVSVTATFNGATAYTRTDTTTVGAAGGAGLTLAKSVRNVTQGGTAATTGTARPNDILEYTITYANAGAGAISAIVINDATPAFTLYQSAACGTLPGNVTGCSVSTQPAVNGTGSVVWTLAGTLLPGGSGSVSYQVKVSN